MIDLKYRGWGLRRKLSRKKGEITQEEEEEEEEEAFVRSFLVPCTRAYVRKPPGRERRKHKTQLLEAVALINRGKKNSHQASNR